MRRTTRPAGRLAFSILVIGAFVAAAPPSLRTTPPSLRLTDSYDQQISQLQQQYSSLGSQLQGLQGKEAAADAQAAGVQQQIASTEAQVAQAQAQIDQLNLALAQTAEAIQVDTARLAGEKAQLTQLMVVIYTGGGAGVVAGLVDSQSIGDFMEKLGSATSVSQRFQQVIAEVRTDEQRLAVLQQTQNTQLAQATQAADQLESFQIELQAQQTELKQDVASLGGQAAGIVDQRESLLSQIATVQAQQKAAEEAAAAAAARAAAAAAAAARGSGGGGICGGVLCPFAFGSIADSFPWGQCTWYVASLRNVTWWGNADEWLGNAQEQGYSTGSTPTSASAPVITGIQGYDSTGNMYTNGIVTSNQYMIIYGNFGASGNSVSLGGQTLPDSSVTYQSATQINVLLGDLTTGPASLDITVSNADGTSASVAVSVNGTVQQFTDSSGASHAVTYDYLTDGEVRGRP